MSLLVTSMLAKTKREPTRRRRAPTGSSEASSLRANGWKARCLIYDCLLVEHRDDANIEHALRVAERAVASRLHIKIQLVGVDAAEANALPCSMKN